MIHHFSRGVYLGWEGKNRTCVAEGQNLNGMPATHLPSNPVRQTLLPLVSGLGCLPARTTGSFTGCVIRSPARAKGGDRTHDLLLTKKARYHCATSALHLLNPYWVLQRVLPRSAGRLGANPVRDLGIEPSMPEATDLQSASPPWGMPRLCGVPSRSETTRHHPRALRALA